MPFDELFFDELRCMTEARIAPVAPLGYRLRPTVPELKGNGIVSDAFSSVTTEFVRELSIRSRGEYSFDPQFRAYPQHIANFSLRRAFRKQLNVGFSAGTDRSKDYVRIGLGFRIDQRFKDEGYMDYWEFQKEVQRDQTSFDNTFTALGNYFEYWDEPNAADPWSHWPLDSSWVVADQPGSDAWRFFGKVLFWSSHNEIVSDCHLFVEEVERVFDQIKGAGYY